MTRNNSNLGPITEEDEKSSITNTDLEHSAEFRRGGVARSTVRNSKKKNFKQLKLDMSICKNNLEPAVKPEILSNDVDNDLDQSKIKTVEVVKTPESPIENIDINICDTPSEPVPNLTVTSPNLSSTEDNVSESPNLSYSEVKNMSLSESEDLFQDLSNDIEDNLSADEEMFEKLSMHVDLENVDEQFEVTLNGSLEDSLTLQVSKTQADNSDTDYLNSDKINISKTAPVEITNDSDNEETEVVFRKSSLRKDIAYWEQRASDSAESRVLNNNIKFDGFKRGSFQRSTIKKSKKKVSTTKDAHLGSNIPGEKSAVEIRSSRSSHKEDDLLELTDAHEKVVGDAGCSTGPYFDDKNGWSRSGCTQPRSIRPKPAPRRSKVLQSEVGGSRTRVLAGNDTNDYLPKLDTDIRTYPHHPHPVVSIKTWDQRRKEKNRIIPTKRLVEWF